MDDREPIRIRNKTLTFEFDKNKTWKKDRIGEQWKPTPPDTQGTASFTVQVEEPEPCAVPVAREITIEVQIDGTPHMFRIYPQRNYDPFSGAFLKTEPKLDSPIGLQAFEGGRKLRFKVHKEVHIAAIYADGTKVQCKFPETERVMLRVKPQARR